MAISGKLAADFEDFYRACDKAEVKMASFDSSAAKVEKRLNSMSDSFSGRRVIQEATLMSEAIERMGGVGKLTEAELQRAGAVAEEAVEKMRKLGVEVPPGIEKIAQSARSASPAIDGLKGAASSFDGILGAFGININKQVKAIEDIATVSGTGRSPRGCGPAPSARPRR